MSANWSYEEATAKMYSVQSRRSIRERLRRIHATGEKCTNLEEMENLLRRAGIPLSKLDELSVIHVAGTKGKGSTSAMCESILRHHGFRTGFLTSDLVHLRERIRLNGRPLDEDAFAKHLQRVYCMLQDTQENETIIPNYYSLLTVMAFYAFLVEKVDVVIVEVFVGGVVDFTNILREVAVVGITSLFLDHTDMLGETLREVAAAKAGIMKRGCEAYTVQQSSEAMDVLTAFSSSVGCSLAVVPSYTCYFPGSTKSVLPVDVPTYRMNASLAIQMSHAWLRITQADTKQNCYISSKEHNGNCMPKLSNKGHNGLTGILGKLVYEVPYETVEGLKQFKWPGRYHVIARDDVTYYLDGAHTKESVAFCAQWFTGVASRSSKITLIFNLTGNRDAKSLLCPLFNIPFNQVIFAAPIDKSKLANYSPDEIQEFKQICETNAKVWLEHNPNSNVTVLDCAAEALDKVKNQGVNHSVLITGSLYLVGAFISLLDPKFLTCYDGDC